ncbi:MAG: SDR family NAD(P)-dependent oxidoreductase [Nocardioidaceae bacterium]
MAPETPGSLALVTGATQGIGRAVAQRLAADGMTVAVNGRANNDAMKAVVDEIGGVPAPADVGQPSEVAAMVSALEREHRPVDVLVSNAAYMSMGRLTNYDLDDWWRVVDTNLSGTYRLIQEVLPGMRRNGHGSIVIISSEWGVTGWPDATAYAASKAGLISLTKSLGRELAPEGIRVNCIAPGVIDTPQLEVDAAAAGVTLEDMHARYAEGIPVGRIGRPEEIAAAVSMLADEKVGSLVGQTIQINGGSTRCRV